MKLYFKSFNEPCCVSMAGVARIELASAVLETVILPLYYTPNCHIILS